MSGEIKSNEDGLVIPKWFVRVSAIAIVGLASIGGYYIRSVDMKIEGIINDVRSNTNSRMAGTRYTAEQAEADKANMREWVREYLASNFPPVWLREDLNDIKAELKILREKLK